MSGEMKRRFSDEALGRIQELSSAVDCECPNHVSQVLQSLIAFEEYSARCKNKNDADARVHQALYEHTQKARLVMEEAMAILLAHENIGDDGVRKT